MHVAAEARAAHCAYRRTSACRGDGYYTGERDVVLSLADDVSTWQPGDKIVVASSDYDMNHAEVFTLVRCRQCTANQVKVNG